MFLTSGDHTDKIGHLVHMVESSPPCGSVERPNMRSVFTPIMCPVALSAQC